jgi:hypothetical protein
MHIEVNSSTYVLFSTSVYLECKSVLGCDFEWGVESTKGMQI